jgi:hypothetical protein
MVKKDDEITIKPTMTKEDRVYFIDSIRRELARKRMLSETLNQEIVDLELILSQIQEEEDN